MPQPVHDYVISTLYFVQPLAPCLPFARASVLVNLQVLFSKLACLPVVLFSSESEVKVEIFVPYMLTVLVR